MKLPSFVAKNRLLSRSSISTIQFYLTLCVTLLSAVLLFNKNVMESLVTTIIDIGLDPLRAQLIAALLLTGGAALVGAAFGRRKGGAMLGGGIAFWLGYLANFLHLEQQPVYDPAGYLEVLNEGVLVQRAAVMLALGLLCAFLGAAVGVACGEVLLDPPYRLLAHIWQRSIHPDDGSSLRLQSATGKSAAPVRATKGFVASWVTAVLMLLLLVLASSSVDLFEFSPDSGLHSMPSLSQQWCASPRHYRGGQPAQPSTEWRAEIISGLSSPILFYAPWTHQTVSNPVPPPWLTRERVRLADRREG